MGNHEDALRSRSACKEALDHAAAVTAILAGAAHMQPRHFDPRLLAAFASSLGEFRDIFETL